MSERDQDAGRLASGAGLDRSTPSIHRINYQFKRILSLYDRIQGVKTDQAASDDIRGDDERRTGISMEARRS